MENISYERFLQDFRNILAVELDSQLEVKLEEKLDAKLEEKLEAKLEEKLDAKLEEKLEAKLEEKLDTKLETKLDAKFDERLKPVLDRLDRMELEQQRTNRKLDNLDIKVCDVSARTSALELTVKRSEKAIRSDIAKLKDANDTLTVVLEAHGMIPVMQ